MSTTAAYDPRFTNEDGTMNENGKMEAIRALRVRETELQCENMKLRQQLAVAKEALEKYALNSNWDFRMSEGKWPGHSCGVYVFDYDEDEPFEVAQEALEKIK